MRHRVPPGPPFGSQAHSPRGECVQPTSRAQVVPLPAPPGRVCPAFASRRVCLVTQTPVSVSPNFVSGLGRRRVVSPPAPVAAAPARLKARGYGGKTVDLGGPTERQLQGDVGASPLRLGGEGVGASLMHDLDFGILRNIASARSISPLGTPGGFPKPLPFRNI